MAVMAMQNALAMGHNGLHILEVSVIRLALSLLCIDAEMIFPCVRRPYNGTAKRYGKNRISSFPLRYQSPLILSFPILVSTFSAISAMPLGI